MREEFIGGKNVDKTPVVLIQLQPAKHAELLRAEKAGAALILQHGHSPLNRADGSSGDIAVMKGELPGVLPHEDEHLLQILQGIQRIAILRTVAEKNAQHAGLRLVQREHPGEQLGAHGLHGGLNGLPVFPVHIPERGGKRMIFKGFRVDPAGAQAPVQRLGTHPGADHAGKIALDIAQKNRDAQVGKALRQNLERDSLAGARGAGDEAVPVGHGGQKKNRAVHPGANLDPSVPQHGDPPIHSAVHFFHILHAFSPSVKKQTGRKSGDYDASPSPSCRRSASSGSPSRRRRAARKVR